MWPHRFLVASNLITGIEIEGLLDVTDELVVDFVSLPIRSMIKFIVDAE